MKRKQLLFTLLLALMVPLAANAYVERTVTVYNGIAKNSHIPIEGWNNGSNQPFSVSFSVSEFDLARAGLYDKPISKMAFHVATPGVYTITNNNRYTIKMRNPAYENEFTTVAEDVLLRIDEYGVMEINFNWHYTYRGGADLIVNISSPMSYQTSYPDHLPQFYGVNIPGVENGYGTHGNGFKPKITFTYFDEATWANTNRPQGLWLTVGSDGTSLGLSWDAVEATDATYKVCCMPRGTTPSLDYNSSNWVTSQNTLSHTFTGLTPNTDYDLYVCARNQTSASAYSRAMCTTKRIANLDEGDLELDFDEGFVSNGITCTGNNSYMLDVIRTRYRPDIYFNLYNSYFLNYEGTALATVNLPQITFSGASNGVIMEFDLWSADNLQVKFIKQGVETSLGTFSAGDNKIHCTVRATDGLANQAHNAYFQLVSSGAFSIDDIVIYKPAATMKPYNIQASDITTNSATITWDDDNTGNVTYYMRYRKSGTENWSTNQSAITQNEYELTGLDTYCQYEVQMMAYRNSTDYSDYTESFVFATACPATPTTYTQSFTNLSDLPSYWHIEMGEYNEYSVSNDRLIVRNNSYEVTTWGTTYTEYAKLDAYVILPYFENLATLQLSFKAGRTAGSYNELVVGVMSDPFDASTFSNLETRILNGPTTTYNYSLANAVPQHGYIAIRLNHYEYNPQSVWFDDFMVTRYAAPTDLTVSDVTNTSATLGWTSVATEWEVRYGTDANSFGDPITVTEPTYTITGLTANTEYTAQVRAKYGDGLYSTWEDGDFGTFKTLMQAPVAMNENNPTYLQDFNFINIGHGWMFLNVPRGDSDDYGWYWGNIGTTYSSRYCIYISDDGGTSNNYFVGNSYELPNGNQGYLPFNETTVYAVKTFDLASGQYTFQYDYRVKGVANKDYARVALVPANIALQGIYAGCPSGLSSTTLPEGWIALDGGTQLPQYESTATWSTKTEQYTVLAPGNYMMVFIWHQDAGSRTHSAVQRPIAIDNVSVTWSSLVYPPEVSYEASQATDTEAPPMYLYAPGLGIAPTSYEVQYEPALAYNNYEGAPIATFDAIESPQSVTLTGLTPKTLYNVRLRSVYTANGHSVYSDWADYPSMFETKYPRPTNLEVVDQTTSWANVVWAPVEMELPEGQYINYWWQLTTDLNDWGEYIGQGQVSNSWTQNFVPGTYYFRVSTAVYQENGNLFMGQSNWSEPITITIAPWTDPVTVFPLIENFDEFPDHFANGLTLDGEYEHLGIVDYLVSGVPAPESGTNQYKLQFRSSYNKTAYLVLPPMRPSTSDALVSFWWYHDNSDNNANEGVTVEHSCDGSTWTTWGNKITRYAEETGWVKYQQVIPASGTDPVYIRLRFDGSNSNDWTRCCYLDDLTVNNFKSYQPYISYVGCDASTADITLYDYGYENGWPSSAFQVQYREYRNPGEPEEEWITYPLFDNIEPYTFINTLTVTGLQPTTLYEFRACARASYGGFDFPWSNYCEPYRQWTSCGTYTITPTRSYTIDFEDEFYYNCWSGDIDETAWHVTTDDAHSGTKSFYVENNVTGSSNLKELRTPPIDLTQLYASTDNVVLRFWVNYTSSSNSPSLRMTSSVNVYNSSSTLYQLCQIPLNTDGWTQIELSLSKQMGDVITIGFKTAQRSHVMWYIDDIEIVANPYPGVKIFDAGGYNYASTWTSSNVWYPNGVPTASDDVMILEGSPSIPHASYNSQVKSIVIGHGGDLYSPTVASSLTVIEGVETHSRRYNLRGEPNNALSIGATTTFTAQSVTIASECPMQVSGVANITTLNPGAANSVIVNDGGVLNATTITTANAGENDRVVIKDGGQVKAENTFYATIEKDITGYGAENVNNHTGYYLVAPTTQVMAVPTFVPQINSQYQFDQMDFYWFDGHQELEWYNPKCPAEGGCESPWGTIPQGHFSAEVGQPLHGYLYARQDDGTVQFAAGSVGNTPFSATNVDTSVDLVFYSNSDAPLNGWNLIGNPYTCNAYLLDENGEIMPFYRMNETGDTIVPAQAGTAIKPCEGVFVVCPSDGQSHQAVFTTTVPATVGEAQDSPMVTVPVHALLGNQEAYLILRQLAELAEGWNWWAPTVQMSVADLQAALDDLEAVISKDGELTNGEDILAPGQMYKLQIGEDCSLNVLGIVVPNASVTIGSGYNWFGCTVETDIDDLNITPAEGDKIISQDQGFAIFNGTSWEGTLTSLEQGKGYIYVRPLTE